MGFQGKVNIILAESRRRWPGCSSIPLVCPSALGCCRYTYNFSAPEGMLKTLILLKYNVHTEKRTHLQLDGFSQSELTHVATNQIKQ